MKLSLVTLSLILMLLICWNLSSISLVHGLSQNELTLSFSWSKSTYYQGDSGSLTISLASTSSDELQFTWVGIHYAWMQTDYYFSLDLSSNIVSIPSGGSTTFSAISFNIPTNAPVGSNEYSVNIHFNEHHWYGWSNGWTWNSPTYLINVHDAYEKTYYGLIPQVSSDMNNAQNANYESPDAKSLLTQAQNEYNLAVALANQGKWQDAVSHVNSASSYLTQAPAKEQTYQDQKRQQQILIIAVVVAIVIALIGVVAFRRRKRTPSLKV